MEENPGFQHHGQSQEGVHLATVAVVAPLATVATLVYAHCSRFSAESKRIGEIKDRMHQSRTP